MQMRQYRDLKVWHRSMDLAVAAYKCTAEFPQNERYGLISQTRRAAVSVACNIAEGQGRSQPGEFLNQLSVARGSLQEFETLCLLAHRLSYLGDRELEALLRSSEEVSRMLTGLRKSVQRAQLKADSRTRTPARSTRNADT